MTIFLIDIHRRNAAKHKHTRKCRQQKNGANHTCVREACPETRRRDSLAQLDLEPPHPSALALLQQQKALVIDANEPRNKPELTCISEEGIADMDLPDDLLEELEYLGDCITSCDKVENYLMMSEYENNLVKQSEVPGILDKRRKRMLSLTKQQSLTNKDSPRKPLRALEKAGSASGHEPPTVANHRAYLRSGNNRSITVIEEASV